MLMWYMLVRMAFWFGLVFWPLALLLLLKIPVVKLRIAVCCCSAICFFILSVISMTFPVENRFFSFKSPESALTYFSSSVEEIIDIIHGEKSCLVLYKSYKRPVADGQIKEGNYRDCRRWYSHTVVSKSSNGYKLPDGRLVTEDDYKLDEDGSFTIYHFKDTNDYYLYGTTELADNKFEIVYAYSNNPETLENNLKRISVSLELGNLPTWEFVE